MKKKYWSSFVFLKLKLKIKTLFRKNCGGKKISNRSKTDYKLGQGLDIGAEQYYVRWKLVYGAKQFLHDCYLQWNSYSKSFIFNFCTFSNFPALEIKKIALVGKILWRFDIMVNSNVISFLNEMVEILHEKFLNVIYLY